MLVRYDAHVKEWRRIERGRYALHDGHVKLWKMETKDGALFVYNAPTRNLTDGYIKKRLCKNFPALRREAIPSALIELERARLLLVRELRGR